MDLCYWFFSWENKEIVLQLYYWEILAIVVVIAGIIWAYLRQEVHLAADPGESGNLDNVAAGSSFQSPFTKGSNVLQGSETPLMQGSKSEISGANFRTDPQVIGSIGNNPNLARIPVQNQIMTAPSRIPRAINRTPAAVPSMTRGLGTTSAQASPAANTRLRAAPATETPVARANSRPASARGTATTRSRASPITMTPTSVTRSIASSVTRTLTPVTRSRPSPVTRTLTPNTRSEAAVAARTMTSVTRLRAAPFTEIPETPCHITRSRAAPITETPETPDSITRSTAAPITETPETPGPITRSRAAPITETPETPGPITRSRAAPHRAPPHAGSQAEVNVIATVSSPRGTMSRSPFTQQSVGYMNHEMVAAILEHKDISTIVNKKK